MSRQGKRTRIAQGIYRDKSGLSAVASVGTQQREKRFPPGTDLKDIRDELERMKAQMRKAQQRPEGRNGTLAGDATLYLPQVKHLASYRTRATEVHAWMTALGANTLRAAVTQADVSRVRVQWLAAGLSPKTINNRVQSLRHWYRTLDGRRSDTPCNDIRDLPVGKTPPVFITADLIQQVDARLQEREQQPWPIEPRWRAIFRVLATTGKRPSELMRAEPSDVDLVRRVWIVRDGKGGYSPGLYLNDDMLAAWRHFADVQAWGHFHTQNFVTVLRESGWPAEVRVYNLRHTTWITASERGADLSDIQAGAGHRKLETTRRHYVPVLQSRMQRLGELLDHRFTWAAVPVPRSVPRSYAEKSQNIRQFAPRPLKEARAK